jgi:hypothetical protein
MIASCFVELSIINVEAITKISLLVFLPQSQRIAGSVLRLLPPLPDPPFRKRTFNARQPQEKS